MRYQAGVVAANNFELKPLSVSTHAENSNDATVIGAHDDDARGDSQNFASNYSRFTQRSEFTWSWVILRRVIQPRQSWVSAGAPVYLLSDLSSIMKVRGNFVPDPDGTFNPTLLAISAANELQFLPPDANRLYFGSFDFHLLATATAAFF